MKIFNNNKNKHEYINKIINILYFFFKQNKFFSQFRPALKFCESCSRKLKIDSHMRRERRREEKEINAGPTNWGLIWLKRGN